MKETQNKNSAIQDNRLLNPICRECIKKHLNRYQDHVTDNKMDKGFVVSCLGIPLDYLSPALRAVLTPAEQQEAINIFDPVSWAKDNIKLPNGEPWIARWYQEQILRCNTSRKITRMGRGTGKTDAIAVDILHYVFTNKIKKVLIVAPQKAHTKEITDRIINFIQSNPILQGAVVRKVETPFFEMTFANGSRIRAFSSGGKGGTGGLGVRGQDGDKIYLDEADYLTDLDLQAIVAILPRFSNVKLWASSTPSGRRAHFWKWCTRTPTFKEFHFQSNVLPHWNQVKDQIIADYAGNQAGMCHEICLSENTLIRTSNGDKYIQDISTGDYVYNHDSIPVLVSHGAICTGKKEVISVGLPYNGFSVCATIDHKFPNRNFDKVSLIELNELPVYKHKKYNRSSREIVLARLIGSNLGDGTINSTRLQSSWYSGVNKDMEKVREDIKFLWPEYNGTVCNDVIINTNKPNKLVKVDGPRSTVNVSVNITKELLQYGCIRGKKVKQEFRVPEFVRNVKEWYEVKKSTPMYTMGDIIHKQESLFIMDNESFNIKIEFLAALFGSEGSTPRVVKGYMPGVISLSMCKRIGIDGSNFFNDLKEILEQLNIKSTWVVKQKGQNNVYILYIYNDQKNIKRFFDTIGYRYASKKEDLAFYWSCYLGHWEWEVDKKNQKIIIARQMRRDGKSYADITKITGLSVSKIDHGLHRGDSTRLYNNEFPKFNNWLKEHLHQDAIFLPIKEKPYKHNSLYKTYNITVESEDHSYLLSNGIRTFNCADFGEESIGVFQHQFIESSTFDYKYSDMVRNPGWTYCMGIDWNSTYGTEMIVTGYDGQGRFKIVDAVNIPKQGWTQLAGLEGVIKLNAKWLPKFIYADQGYGATNLELLQKYGFDLMAKNPSDPGARLRDIVKGYNFSSKIELIDPATQTKIYKSAKPFAIENTVRFFEEQRLQISAWDNILLDQLKNYIITHTNIGGIPVYGLTEERVGDHRLIALVLSLVSFKLEMSDFAKPKYTVSIGINPGFNNQHKTDEQKLTKLKHMAEDRFNLNSISIYQDLPGKTDSGNIQNYRHGFDTDEEDKLYTRYMTNNLKKRAYFGPKRPNRTTF